MKKSDDHYYVDDFGVCFKALSYRKFAYCGERDLAFGIIARSLKGGGRARRPQQKAEGGVRVGCWLGSMHKNKM